MTQFRSENDDGITVTWLQCDACGEDSTVQREPAAWAVWEDEGWVRVKMTLAIEQQHFCVACA